MNYRASAIVLAIASGVLAGAVGGCAPYVNIPAQRGDLATHTPNNGTVRHVMAAALAHVLAQRRTPEAYAVALPQRASSHTYHRVLEQLPGEPAAHRVGPTEQPVFSVVGVYVRGAEAQVDVVAPTAEGASQLTSVYLEAAMDGWWVVRDREWSIPIEQAIDLAYPGKTID